MKVSVVIPAYNCATTIGDALNSVLSQSVQPDEILVMDDGSKDQTASILHSYEPQVTVLRQPNRGVACARNTLWERAQGDLIAFLDSDDVWHPCYLEVLSGLFARYPQAAAIVTGHLNFQGQGPYRWPLDPLAAEPAIDVMPPLEFFKRFNTNSGPFTSYSFCCIRKKALQHVREPFKVDGTEDFYCNALLALAGGTVVYTSSPLAAYRVREDSLSSDRLKSLRGRVNVFELLEESYRGLPEAGLSEAFEVALASHRRSYGKFLMGAQRVAEARTQLRCSLRGTANPASIAKSMGLLFLTYMPPTMQPSWPASDRKVVF